MQPERIAGQREDICNIEIRPQMEVRTMTMIVALKQAILQLLAEKKQQMEEDRAAEAAKHASKAAAQRRPQPRRTRRLATAHGPVAFAFGHQVVA